MIGIIIGSIITNTSFLFKKVNGQLAYLVGVIVGGVSILLVLNL